jgi:hypothetical protein
MCNICQNGWCIIRGTQPERRVLPLESRSYNKSCPSPKAYCFSKSVDKKSLLVSSPCLASFNSACISFTTTKCAPWFKSIIEPCWSSFKQVPYMVMVHLSSHVVLISHVTSWIILFELPKESLFPITTIVAPQVPPCILLGTLRHMWIIKAGPIPKIALFISTPCQYGLPTTSCIYLIQLSRRTSPPLAPRSLPPFNYPDILCSIHPSSFLVLSLPT